MAGRSASGPDLAEAGNGEIDDAGFAFGDGGVAEAQTIDHAGAEALQEDVGAVQEAPEDGLAVGLLQVEGDGAFAQVGGDRVGALVAVDDAQIACPVADAGWLDLDDVGAVLGEQHRAVGAGDALADVDHLQAGEWLFVAHAGGWLPGGGSPGQARGFAGKGSRDLAIWRALVVGALVLRRRGRRGG